MEQQEAKDWIETIITNKIIVHPDRARQLYNDAGYETPEHLKQKVMTQEELKQMKEFGKLLLR